ncbi:hypothetical protein HY501_00720 [Candidatus Woesearchaeota archaeon]|nr:hypothetical protein [Candidatus Woesearchaeota archaeon]
MEENHLGRIKKTKTTTALAAVIGIYMLLFLLLPTQTTCGTIQSADWKGGYNLAFYTGFLILFVVMVVLRFRSSITTRELMFFLLVLLFFIYFIQTFYLDGILIAECTGTVLTDNWWAALNWIKNNTAECSVVATYWDPGHFITGIAKRSVVFDGASQGETITVQTESNLSGMTIQKLEKGIDRILIYKDGKETRARIQDISTTLLTSNETLAVDILKDYNKPGCEEMYYIASSDLIGKSTWWTYFATWNPLDTPEFGQRYNYLIANLESARPILGQNSIAFTYRFGQNQAFVIYETNGTLTPFIQQGNQFLHVQKLFYFDRQGNGIIFTDESADLPGLLWLEPQRNTIVYMQPELEDALFTRMFFFDGRGLENFEFVSSWGGEVKLFRVRLDSI